MNILIYDFKKMIIERFSPEGSYDTIEDNIMDDIFEEELTWNTGFKYIRPSEYMPFIAFQTISNELNSNNIKNGDLGGFCVAWCFWYFETKLKNSNIDSKILIKKLLSKLNNLDIKYSEYIRNYANFLTNKKIKYIEKIGCRNCNYRELTNENSLIHHDNKFQQFIINKFKNGLT
jgi:hypothetical protein